MGNDSQPVSTQNIDHVPALLEVQQSHNSKDASSSSSSPPPPRLRGSRSASPAKRSASEMDGDAHTEQEGRCGHEDEHEHADRMEVDPLGSQPKSNRQHRPEARSATVSISTEESSGARRVSSSTISMQPDILEPLPCLDDQVEAVWAELKKPASEDKGGLGYVVSYLWLSRVIARSKFEQEMGPFAKQHLEGEIGPIDNSNIIDSVSEDSTIEDEAGKQFVPLLKGLQIGTDVQILPPSAWDMIYCWYGLSANQRPIIRYLHKITAPSSDLPAESQYELYPPLFTLQKLSPDQAVNGPENLAPAPRVLASTSMKYMEFLKVVKRQLGILLTTRVKLARIVPIQSAVDTVPCTSTNGIPSPPASRDNSPVPDVTPNPSPLRRLIDENTFKRYMENGQADVIDNPDESMNDKYNGSTNLDFLGLRVDQSLVVVVEQPLRLPGPVANKSLPAKELEPVAVSGRASRRASPSIMTRGRHRAQGRSRGSVGFTNLGNTCYMNSALQCMRACQELSIFLISDSYISELNPDNPIGHRGQIASSYANLLHEVYDKSNASLAPRSFKNTLGRFAPMFSGYGQQDSQEFMSFLVDGLHEDLNRIKHKPYRENPDSDDATVHDPEAIRQLGQVFRDNHRARNSSIITDLFNGFYKNKLVCPECDKISITFDPFSLLTLQLPMEHYWEFTFEFCPLQGKPLKMRVNNSKGQTIKHLKEFVASKFPGLDPQRMIMYEHFQHKIYRVMQDWMSIAEANLSSNDDMCIVELEHIPTNRLAKPRKSSLLEPDRPLDNPDDNQRQLVTIFHRAPPNGQYLSNRSLTLTPWFIILSPDEADSYTEIYRKILRWVFNATTVDLHVLIDEYNDLQRNEAHEARDAAHEPKSEGDGSMTEQSRCEKKISLRSLGSESFIDVTMDDDRVGDDSSCDLAAQPSRCGFLRKGARIPAPLGSLFDIHVSRASEAIPHGNLTGPEPTRNGVLLRSRIPKPVAASSPEDSAVSSVMTETSEDSTQEDSMDASIEAQMSFEEEKRCSLSCKPGSARNNKHRRSQKLHQKKHEVKWKNLSQSRQKSRASSESIPDLTEDGNARLLRPLEYISLEWKPEMFERLFGSAGGQSRDQMAVFKDDELEHKLRAREQRRKKGVSLQDCFVETAKEEILTEENAWYCSNCKERRQAAKKLEIWTIPDILVIHLKRFSSGRSFRDKVDMLVDFPVEGLDLTGRVGVDEDKPLVYDLFAVDNHYGGLGGGHYTAFAKNFFDNQWCEYNDSHVSKCNPEAVVTKAAYLLFYRRRSDNFLGPPRIRSLVQHYMRGDSTENESDDSESRSGHLGNEADPTGDSYHYGSSSASRDPVAACPPLDRGVNGSGLDDDSGMEMELVRFNPNSLSHNDDDFAPPNFDDEGLGMEEDERPIARAYSNCQSGWSFAALGPHLNKSNRSSRSSIEPNFSENEYEKLGGGKLAEDFGDDVNDENTQGIGFMIGPQLPSSSYRSSDTVSAGAGQAGNAGNAEQDEDENYAT